MPALIIPACGFTVGSVGDPIFGLRTKESRSGGLRGWVQWTGDRRLFNLNFEIVTLAERLALLTFVRNNLLANDITFTWIDGVNYACQFVEDPYSERARQDGAFWSCELRLRKVAA